MAKSRLTPYGRRCALEAAEFHLRRARELIAAADAPRTVARVRLALTSLGGAIRHAQGREGAYPGGISRAWVDEAGDVPEVEA